MEGCGLVLIPNICVCSRTKQVLHTGIIVTEGSLVDSDGPIFCRLGMAMTLVPLHVCGLETRVRDEMRRRSEVRRWRSIRWSFAPCLYVANPSVILMGILKKRINYGTYGCVGQVCHSFILHV